MADPFIAEIRIFPYTFAPRNWARCDGQVLPISQHTALFSLIGTTYGGDGRTTMALPNLKGRAPMHPGTGPGLSLRKLGQTGGAPSVTLTEQQLPAHQHQMQGVDGSGGPTATEDPTNHTLGTARFPGAVKLAYQSSPANVTQLDGQALATTGGGQAHDNMQPYLGLQFCIALEGIFPSRA